MLIARHIVRVPREPDVSLGQAGYCIYCGIVETERPLGREHIIPDGLGGNLTLGRASCKDCEDDIAAFEAPVVNHNFSSVRVARSIHSTKKRKSLRATTYSTFNYDGKRTGKILHKASHYDTHFIVYDVLDTRCWALNGNPEHMDRCKIGITGLNTSRWPYRRGYSTKILLGGYAKLAAKIGHSYAAAILGQRFVPTLEIYCVDRCDIIYRKFIGQVERRLVHTPGVLHNIELHISVPQNVDATYGPGTPIIVAYVDLFCEFQIQSYEICVGTWGADSWPVQSEKTLALRAENRAERLPLHRIDIQPSYVGRFD